MLKSLKGCMSVLFFYFVIPLLIMFALTFIPWKPEPDLRHAAAKGDVALIQNLIAAGDDININTNTGPWTPIAYAAERGHIEAVKELLKHKPTFYLTPLVAAAGNGHKAVVELLLQDVLYRPWLNTQMDQLYEVFSGSAKDNNLEMLEFLYEHPLLKEAPNALNEALVEASIQGQEKAVDWLIANGANVQYATSPDRYTPLMMAAATNNEALVKKFMSLGANVQAKTAETSETALSVATENDYTAIVQLLQDAAGR